MGQSTHIGSVDHAPLCEPKGRSREGFAASVEIRDGGWFFRGVCACVFCVDHDSQEWRVVATFCVFGMCCVLLESVRFIL